ncbi:DNRLRE domain-containing protein [Nonomuraea phyllanthi]|uniref:DNRLRE domain-containing protein n=1 Tax=Nonomuraea phyllanthi TaxID=2219224 RepID=UPI0018856541|nr:DNRLRE domain-containing protein [Nonomuraea phyllanthi]
MAMLVGMAPLPIAQAATTQPSPSPAQPLSTRQPVAERPDRVSAALSARLQGSRVLIGGETTEFSASYANPDGTVTLETSGEPIRTRQAERWVPIDTSLIEQDGVIRPRAVTTQMTLEFSTGGEGPFAKLTRPDGKFFALSWPNPLPKPRIEGNQVVYADAAGLPGADLVVTALATGFRHDVVLRERPTGLVEFKLPIQTKGVTLSESNQGGLTLSDAKGKPIASAPEPVMYGTSARQVRQTAGALTSPAAIGKIDTTVITEGDHQVLVLRPDTKFLVDPNTHFPVTVDPTIELTATATRTILGPYSSTTYQSGIRVGTFDNPTNNKREFTRALLKFDTTALAGKTVIDAKLQLTTTGFNLGCVAGQNIKAQRITANWTPSSTYWANQPAAATAGEQLAQQPGQCTSTPPEGTWTWPITDIAKAWAGGAAGHGVMLRLATEHPVMYEQQYERNFASPTLIVTYGSTPAVENLRAAPVATSDDGIVYTNTTTPTLNAFTKDPDNGLLRAEFEVEHDPAATGQGTGQVWIGAVDNVSPGAEAKLAVTTGKLIDGGKYRWRSRAFDGTDYSAWSAWQLLAVDATAPQAPTISCPIQEGGWAFFGSDDYECSLSSAGDVTGFWWGLDNPSTPSPAKLTAGNVNYILDLGEITQGQHTLYAKSRDRAHNTSAVTAYTFGVTPGGIITPTDESRTFRSVQLTAAAPPARTAVRYEMTNIGPSDFQPIPTSDITVPGSGTPISGWPQTRSDTSKPFTELSWDVAKSLQKYPTFGGVVELRACFSGSTAAEECTDPITITVEKATFGASYATADIGPGRVALQSGDFSVTATDASHFGINVSRTATTLDPAADRIDEQLNENKVFGPGWRAGFPASIGDADFSPTGGDDSEAIQFVGPDGETWTYVREDVRFVGSGEAADGSRVIIDTVNGKLSLTDRYGATTTYTKDELTSSWRVIQVESAAEESRTVYQRDYAGRITRVISPAANGVSCDTSLTAGCRALALAYAGTTTATGVGSGWGDYAGQVKQAAYTAFDPVTNAMKTTVVASYLYDSTGHLRQVSDPRTGLATTYYYNGEGRLSQITPPGLTPWRMDYDTQGRLAHVQREAGEYDLTTAAVYDVPISGSNAPIDLTSARTSVWGQATDLPVVGAAIFPPTHLPARAVTGAYQPTSVDWEHSKLTYADVNGRPVNSASYGAGAWQITSTQFDDRGNTVWDLSPENRNQALTPTADTDPYVAGRTDTAERANLLAGVQTFSADRDLLESMGPTHPVQMADGRLVSARQRTTNVYDEGKPSSSTTYHLPTTTIIEPVVVDGGRTPAAADRTTKKLGYDPIKSGDASGWTLRKATTVTSVIPDGSDIIQRTRYDAAGRTIESRTPKSGGTDAGTTVYSHYTAGAHPNVAECGNTPHWAGLTCRTSPAAQPTGAPLPVETMSYDYYGQLAVKTETSGSTVRTSTSTFDGAGRITTLKVEVTPASDGGVPVPIITYGYDQSTGAATTISAAGKTITTAYDTLGRPTAYTDASGNTATTAYDAFGRPASINDGKGAISLIYDGVDAVGKVERRGKTTRVEIPGVATFGYAFDANGRKQHEVLPGGLTATTYADNAGTESRLTYHKDGQTWLSFTATSDVMSRTLVARSPMSQQRHTFDAVGRLTTVQDTYNGACVTRTYGFDQNTNRTSQASYPAGAGGACSTSTTSVMDTHTYDAADRITDPGYSYDNLVRVLTTPGDQVAGGQVLTSSYHANDMVASLSQGGQSQTFTLDPLGRVRTQTDASGTTTHHFATSADTPAWTAEADGSWTRYLSGLGGMNATYRSNGLLELQLANLHGDIVATTGPTATGITSYGEYTEFGAPRETAAASERYGWLGSKQRGADTVGDVVLMGVRVYNPTTGRMLQTDPVPQGCANRQDYAHQNPINGFDLDGRKCYGGTYQVFDDSRFQSCHDVAAGVYAAALVACGVAAAATLGVGFVPCATAASAAYAGAVSWCRANAYKTCCKKEVIERVYDRKCAKKNKKGKCIRWRDAKTYREVAKPGEEICWW